MSKEELSEKIYQNLGTASMAWSETPTGVFDSTLAIEIGQQSMQAIESYTKQEAIAFAKWATGDNYKDFDYELFQQSKSTNV